MMELETNQKWILEDESIPHKSPKPRQDGMGSWAWQFAKGQAKREQNECFKLHYNMMTLVGFLLYRPSVKSLNNCESPPNEFFWYSQLLVWPQIAHPTAWEIQDKPPSLVSERIGDKCSIQILTPKKHPPPIIKWLQNYLWERNVP